MEVQAWGERQCPDRNAHFARLNGCAGERQSKSGEDSAAAMDARHPIILSFTARMTAAPAE